MKSYRLRSRILLLAATPLFFIAVAFGWHLAEHRNLELNQARFDQLDQLTLPIAALFEQHLDEVDMDDGGTLNDERFNAYGRALLSSKLVRSVTILSPDYKVLSHQGEKLGAHLNPSHFPVDQPKLFELQNQSVFIVPLGTTNAVPSSSAITTTMNPTLTGWLLIVADPTQFRSQIGAEMELTTYFLLLVLALSLLVVFYLRRTITKPIAEVAGALQRIVSDAPHVRVPEIPVMEVHELGQGINTLAERLSQIQADMRREIEQTTEDLRETLETIEIQNVDLDLARKQAVLANRTKSEFLANMSHEIRTPLNGIIGFTNLLLKSQLSSRQQDHLLTIKKSSEILLLIINDILDFSKIEAGKLLLEKSPVNIQELIEDVVIMLAPTAHAKNLELVHLHYQDVPIEILGDPLRIKQIVTNLVNNGIKFTQTGEVIVRVMLADDKPGVTRDFIKVSVTDTGVGLSRAQQHSIFNAFSQADASTARNFGGTGLGLTISKKLIEQMDGTIEFDSELGKGSVFWFTLPIERPKQPLHDVPPSHLKGTRIGCFEPRRAPQLALEHLLQAWQLNYQFAESIDQLVALAKSTPQSDKGDNLTLLCLDRNELNQPTHTAVVKQLVDTGQKVLLVTPTLEDYTSQIFQFATAHVVKPLTRTRLYHALCELKAKPFGHFGSAVTSAHCTTSVDGENQLNREHQPNQAPAFKISADNSPAMVLVVDDNDINVSLIYSLLESMGLASDVAHDGFQALAMCQNRSYPLILMDIQMPGMDGVETMKKIRQLNPEFNTTPIIALTAYALPEERETFLQHGFQNLITKPIDERKIRDALETYLPDALTSRVSGLDESAINIVDLTESVRLSNGNTALAINLLEQFLAALPRERAQITELFNAANLTELEYAVHKLHGACHYCGVPTLRTAVREAESTLKTAARNPAALGVEERTASSATVIANLTAEIDQVLRWSEQQKDAWKNSPLLNPADPVEVP